MSVTLPSKAELCSGEASIGGTLLGMMDDDVAGWNFALDTGTLLWTPELCSARRNFAGEAGTLLSGRLGRRNFARDAGTLLGRPELCSRDARDAGTLLGTPELCGMSELCYLPVTVPNLGHGSPCRGPTRENLGKTHPYHLGGTGATRHLPRATCCHTPITCPTRTT